MFAKNTLERFHLNFLGPIVYNGINTLLENTGEKLIETIEARNLMEGRRMGLIKTFDTFLRPIRWLGINVPNFEEGSMGIFNHSFGITTSIPYFELGPYEAFRETADDYTIGHIKQYEGRKTFPIFDRPCNRVAGGDGMFFARPVKSDRLEVFIQYICRILPFIRKE